MKTRYICLTAFYFLINTQGIAQKSFASLDSLFNVYDRQDDFNGIVLIAQQGEVVFSRSIGYAILISK